MVGIARVRVGQPLIIFADEPTGIADSNTGAIIEDTLFKLNQKKGIKLIIVIHGGELAAKCACVIKLKNGDVITDRRQETSTAA